MFDCLTSPGVDLVAGPTPPQRLANAVHGALVGLAERGDPGWEPDAGGAGPTRVFDVPVHEALGAYDSAAALL